jgi:hypothetical protein
MFKIGDIVKIVNAKYKPLFGCPGAVGIVGEIIQISDLGNFQVGVSGYWASELSLELVSESKETVATAQTSDYKSHCPCCGQKAYINLFDRIDCSNSGCSTKNPSHPRHYS